MSGPASFTPSAVVDPSKERDWAAQLGMLDWDTTNIVFTKRSLLEFLKYAGVTVDTNFTNIQKLPRYVQFGKFASSSTPELEPALTDAASAPSASSTAASDFKPTRRVREAPGGVTHDIFGSSADDDALSRAPTNPPAEVEAHAPASAAEANAENEGATAPAQQRKKSNNSSGIASLWDAPDESEAFKPTRRVREMPGGKDSISGLF